MGRPPCCDKSNVKRGLWTAAEDAKILAYVSKHGVGNWTLVPKKAGLNRCGKSCRLRWTNYLRPDLKHDTFTPEEEERIINLHKAIGSRWSVIARQLPGRTDNDVKNYWNTKLKKKLSKMGIDPVTHKPFSQILSDFGNIGAVGNQFEAFFKSANNRTFVPESEPPSGITGLPYTNMMMNNAPLNVGQGISENSSASTLSLGFIAQVQAINHDGLQMQPHFLNEVASSCSSSSSPRTTDHHQFCSQTAYPRQQPHDQAQITPSSSFNWSEFLLQDPFSSADQLTQAQDLHGHCKLATISEHNNNFGAMQACEVGSSATVGGFQRKDHLPDQASSSSMNSFVDTILDQDSEMQAAFPELLDGSFDF